MIILSPLEAQELLKAKYTKRWKGKDGKWHYEYGKPTGKKGSTPSKIESASAMHTEAAVMDAIQATLEANPEGTIVPATFTAFHGRAATQTAFKTARHHGVIEVAYQGDRGPVYRAGPGALNIERAKPVGEKSEKFTPFMLAKLKAEYSKLKGIDPASPTYTKLTDKLDAMTESQLIQVADAKIKFVSMLARNRLFKVKDKPTILKPEKPSVIQFKMTDVTPKGYGPNG